MTPSLACDSQLGYLYCFFVLTPSPCCSIYRLYDTAMWSGTVLHNILFTYSHHSLVAFDSLIMALVIPEAFQELGFPINYEKSENDVYLGSGFCMNAMRRGTKYPLVIRSKAERYGRLNQRNKTAFIHNEIVAPVCQNGGRFWLKTKGCPVEELNPQDAHDKRIITTKIAQALRDYNKAVPSRKRHSHIAAALPVSSVTKRAMPGQNMSLRGNQLATTTTQPWSGNPVFVYTWDEIHIAEILLAIKKYTK